MKVESKDNSDKNKQLKPAKSANAFQPKNAKNDLNINQIQSEKDIQLRNNKEMKFYDEVD